MIYETYQKIGSIGHVVQEIRHAKILAQYSSTHILVLTNLSIVWANGPQFEGDSGCRVYEVIYDLRDRKMSKDYPWITILFSFCIVPNFFGQHIKMT